MYIKHKYINIYISIFLLKNLNAGVHCIKFYNIYIILIIYSYTTKLYYTLQIAFFSLNAVKYLYRFYIQNYFISLYIKSLKQELMN